MCLLKLSTFPITSCKLKGYSCVVDFPHNCHSQILPANKRLILQLKVRSHPNPTQKNIIIFQSTEPRTLYDDFLDFGTVENSLNQSTEYTSK